MLRRSSNIRSVRPALGEPYFIGSDMTRNVRRICRGAVLTAILVTTVALHAQNERTRAAWNRSQKPFKVFGNTYWVGTYSLGSVLVTSDAGHVLIDAALPESVPQIRDHIRELGFKVDDIRLILNTHDHYDHAGGIAELQRLSGALVAASAPSAEVLKTGMPEADDPQSGLLAPIEPVPSVQIVRDGETLSVGSLRLTAHMTPGHTAGGTSWSWRSCENGRCLNVVYADSLSPVSNDTFKYAESPLLKALQESGTRLENLPCDILLTPHTGFSPILENLAARQAGKADAFVDDQACKTYVTAMRANLVQRLKRERGQ
jgi:metallo-beta-lactamase class B